MASNINLASLTTPQGFSITGANAGDQSGYSVSNAGDVNGDGKDDILVASLAYNSNTGIVYLIYGRNNLSNINLASLGSSGITITGAGTHYSTGSSVSGAGDVNGDGKADIIIGAPEYSSNTGIAYLIYGSSSLSNINLANLGSSGISISYTGTCTSCKIGLSVSAAGDVNGDGKADFIIGAPYYSSYTGIAYLIYGSSSLSNINLASLGNSGIYITGTCTNCNIGWSVSGAGDINGDGKDDVIIGAPYYSTNTGIAYLIYGSSSLSNINLDSLSSSGIYITGASTSYKTGYSVSAAGDINGDGKDDFIISAYGYFSSTGIVYIVYGGSSLSNINLASLGSQGISIAGINTDDDTGFSVSNAGDVNGDGYDDVIIGAYGAYGYTGISYVILGKRNALTNINLAGLLSTQGFYILGESSAQNSGYSVSGGGDINRDGYDDIIIGAFNAGGSFVGKSYVIYGAATGFVISSPTNQPTPATPAINLNFANLISTEGISITGATSGDYAGWSVSNAGDVNDDGKDDVIIGAPAYSSSTGIAYIIYGNHSLANINLANLGTAGITISYSTGSCSNCNIGYSVSGAGDINGDGKDDVVIGAYGYSSGAGIIYLIYGSSSLSNINLANSLGTKGISIVGNGDNSGYSVNGIGDINGDGKADLIIGAQGYGAYTGIIYVIYGSSSLSNINLVNSLGSGGITITGANVGDHLGISVSNAGDVNGDGKTDIIIGAPYYSSSKGIAYLIYGGSSLSSIALSSGIGSSGVSITGANTGDSAGWSVNGVGDVNGDGKDDIIIGAPNYSSSKGIVYLIYGGGSLSSITLSTNLGSSGISIVGANTGDKIGYSVNAAGDINKDGYADIIIGAPAYSSQAGIIYIIYGGSSLLNINLASLTSAQGISITGAIAGYNIGWSVSCAGDINRDGKSDLIFGGLGLIYVMYGANSGLVTSSPTLAPTTAPSTIPTSIPTKVPTIAPTLAPTHLPTKPTSVVQNTDLSRLQPYEGFAINGANAGDQSGYSISSAGDVNGDGKDDILIGAYGYSSYAGIAYLIYGGNNLHNINLGNIGNQGIMINSNANSGDNVGWSVSSAGDINGDGKADVLIGAPVSYGAKGAVYVVYGNSNMPNISVENLNNLGVMIKGANGGDHVGWSVSGAGDINKDGYADIIIGAPYYSSSKGIAYIIYGGNSLSNIDLASLNLSQGFSIIGTHAYDNTGYTVSGAGDINKDGYADVIIGANAAASWAGISYVIFGKASNANIQLPTTITQGFSITGAAINDESGASVSGAGDLNGDGYADIIIGAPAANNWVGSVYVMFGKQTDFINIALVNLTISQGFIMTGGGSSVSKAGDINGDGYSDIIINGDYVIFGKVSGFTNIALSNLANSQGFSIIGGGSVVSGGGDFNGDGYSDYTIGAPGTNFGAGVSYVLFGNQYQTHVPTLAPTPSPTHKPTHQTSDISNIDLSLLNSALGFSITGANSGDQTGFSVSSVGDINKDGYADIIIGVYDSANKGYVIFGKSSGFSNIALSNLDISQGFSISGASGSATGYSVSGAGDVNKDGYDDIIIGAFGANGNAGKSYIIFGKQTGFANITLTNLPINQGFSISGVNGADDSGYSVSGAGDINGDGYDDIIIGAFQASPNSHANAGESYVIFGNATFTNINLASLSLAQGFSIIGANANDRSGNFVSSAGDINGDGYSDILIAAYNANSNAGATYVIFGKANGFASINLYSVSAAHGFFITGANSGDHIGYSVSKAGDINGDGYDDIIIGSAIGISYLIFGKQTYSSNITLSNLVISQGFSITGSGFSVSGAGDVNGDGYDDIIISGSYIVFGKQTGLSNIVLSNSATSQGFHVIGSSTTVSGAGDFNGDGYADIIIAAYNANSNAGITYVIFGNRYQSQAPTVIPTTIPTAMPTEPNIVANPGAESGNIGWTGLVSNYANGWQAVEYDGYTGSWAFITQSHNVANMSQVLSLATGATYAVSFFAASDYFNSFIFSIGGQTLVSLVNLVSPGSYIQYSASFTASNSAEILKISASTTTNSILLDDISVSLVNPENLVSNPSAQNGNTGWTGLAIQAGTNLLTQWVVEDNLYAHSGSVNFLTESTSGVTMSQSLLLAPFATYRVTFWAASSALNSLSLSMGGNTLISLTSTPTSYTQYTSNFIFGSSTEALQISGSTNNWINLDDILVTVVPNLVNNGGAETCDMTGWTDSGSYNTNGWSDSVQTSAYPHSGSCSFFTDSGTATMLQSLSFAIGATYAISFWAKASYGCGGSSSSALSINVGGSTISSLTTLSAAPNYAQYSSIFTASRISEVLQISGSTNCEIFFDDIVVSEISTANLVTNQGAETGSMSGWTIPGIYASNGWVAFNSNAHSGSWSFLTESTSSVSMSQSVPLAAFATYTVSLWVRELYSNCVSSTLDLRVGGISLISLTTNIITSGYYYQSTSSFIASSSTEILQITASTVSGCGVLVDDISVTVIPNLVNNGGAELGMLGWSGSVSDYYSGWSPYSDGRSGSSAFLTTSSSPVSMNQSLSLTAGTTYAASFWAKPANPGSYVLSLSVGGNAIISLTSLSGFYTQYNADFTAQSTAEILQITGSAPIFVDDIIIVALEAPTSQPSRQPSSQPTHAPSPAPTPIPTFAPTSIPILLPINLATLASHQGYSISGTGSGEHSGWSVSGAGDVHGDGYVNVIIGAPESASNPGISFVIYSKTSGFSNMPLTYYNDGSYIGFSIRGSNSGDNSGYSVSGAGDIDNNGKSGVIIGAPNAASGKGVVYVMLYFPNGPIVESYPNDPNAYGKATNGYYYGMTITGASSGDHIGYSVSKAGDVNHDGYDDIIIGAPLAASGIGMSYVIFGAAVTYGINIDLGNLTAIQGFSITGENYVNGQNGYSVSGGGDINGDGYSDIIIGAYGAASYAGISYVIFGKHDGFSNINLPLSNSAQGFAITGSNGYYRSGYSVSSAGDVNHDGYDDIIIGEPLANAHIGANYIIYNSGVAYVIYGKQSGFSNINLASLDSTQGFKIYGATGDKSGWSVSSAGDVNHDGYADIIIGAPYANNNAGKTYVIFGKAHNFDIELASISSFQGFVVMGANSSDQSGYSVSGVGDLNKDGYGDMIIGAPYANSEAGISYVIFGGISPTPMPTAAPTHPTPIPTHLPTRSISDVKNIDLSSLNIAQGFSIIGAEEPSSYSGYSVSGAGDINGDGYADIIIGVPNEDHDGECYNVGITRVIFGKATGFANINIDVTINSPTSTQGFSIMGVCDSYSGYSVSGGGDINGDGYADIIIGAPGASSSAGKTYVIYGGINLANTNLASLTATQGFSITGAVSGDKSGYSVGSVGDFNKDGYDDVIIGAPYASANDGMVYIIFGKTNNFTDINLGTLIPSQGISIINLYGFAGFSVSGAGDINKDGYSDVIIGSYGVYSYTGRSYVVFGSNRTANINMNGLPLNQALIIEGSSSGSNSGYSVSKAGDFNGDGYADVIIGEPGTGSNTGISYIIFGKAVYTNHPDKSSFPSDQGFSITGDGSFGYLGHSVSCAGDVNGDGYSDVIIGAYAYSGNMNTGRSYVIFGKSIGFTNIALSSLTNAQGFSIMGINPGDKSGWAVSSAGDFNGDGYADFIIGAPGANSAAGISYVIFGNSYQTNAPTPVPTVLPTHAPTNHPTMLNRDLQNINLATLSQAQGFSIIGTTGERSGSSVSYAGDINDDGKADIIIGAPAGNIAYVIYGGASLANLNIATLARSQGFYITGSSVFSHYLGGSVSYAGDVNGDSYTDIVIGAKYATDTNAGMSYVIYGGVNLTNIILDTLTIAQGFSITGAKAGDCSGLSVSGAGDVNGDGRADVIIGAPYVNSNKGMSYVIYGGVNLTNINLDNLTMTQGISIAGYIVGGMSGVAVSGAGDVNGDGKADVIIGALYSGVSYVVYGKSNLANIVLSNFNITQGFSITDSAQSDYGGSSVSGAGDVNGDGYADIIIGAEGTDTHRGVSYIIYGGIGLNNIVLSSLTTMQGISITGAASYDYSGRSVSRAGDVNGDGYADVIVGAPYTNAAGVSYVIYGGANLNNIALSTLTTTQGFAVTGTNSNDQSGSSVSYAGDVNGDGYADIIIGAYNADSGAGVSYVILDASAAGNPSAVPTVIPTISPTQNPTYIPTPSPTHLPTRSASDVHNMDLSLLNIAQGFSITGTNVHYVGGSVSNAGDINKDGYSDIIISATNTTNGVGIGYVLFGRENGFNNIDLDTITLSQGFIIYGANHNGCSGYCVSNAGDVNKDGYSDIAIGIWDANYGYNAAYVIFGKSNNFANIDLDSLNGIHGFSITGYVDYSNFIGYAVSGAGDINGDGYDDVVIGSWNVVTAGTSYVIFGKQNDFSNIYIPNMTPEQGFLISNANAANQQGTSVSGAGDINKDGYADIILGAAGTEVDYAGISWVIFGNHTLTNINLNNLSPKQGFSITGAIYPDESGCSVSIAGDVNGDGYVDILIGAYGAASNKGVSYIIFGNSTGFSNINLANLHLPYGFYITGASTNGESGVSVKAAGDVNGDGYDDIIIGTYRYSASNIAYIIFGKPSYSSNINLATLTDSQGFTVFGINSGFGSAVSGAGDFNGDGYADYLIGIPEYNSNNGISYVLFGNSYQTYFPTSQPSDHPSRQPSDQPSSHPSDQPTEQPSIQPYDRPSGQPSACPSMQPSGYPSYQPSAQPSEKPSRQPTERPSEQPTERPSRQPSVQPSDRPSGQPSDQPTEQPTMQPSYQPTAHPSRQPSGQPSNQPSAQPSGQPTMQPSLQPSGQPSDQPTEQPSIQPSDQPSTQPSVQPSMQPSLQPSGQPSDQPTEQPSMQPSDQPSTQPSEKPSEQPTGQPSDQPTMQPSDQPSEQPSAQPTSEPSSQPSLQPSNQPSAKPSIQPSVSPSEQPTEQPSSQPTMQPSNHPSGKPSRQPTAQPSSQPSGYPSIQPSEHPSEQPSGQPTSQPSNKPTDQPTGLPSEQPTHQPTAQPSRQPSAQPSMQPSGQPSDQPSAQPSEKPSRQPTERPSSQPTMQPSDQPSEYPTEQPSGQPSAQPSEKPSRQPTERPSEQPTERPSTQPSDQPTMQPSGKPSSQSSVQPSMQPSSQPSDQPSAQPTEKPSRQPTGQPSDQPSAQPTEKPSRQPTGQPSDQPTMQPSDQPSEQPSAQPTSEPSSQPSLQPSNQPSAKPSIQPSVSPSSQPSKQPTSEPSSQPSDQPSEQPSAQPTNEPSSQPSLQPSDQPSAKPSGQPSICPSAQPSGHPSDQPSTQPSEYPTEQPSDQPTMQPSRQPTGKPSAQPSSQPSSQPTGEPSSQPSGQPSICPSAQPSSHPSDQPSTQPSEYPTEQPSDQPTMQPSRQPTGKPSTHPSEYPTEQPSDQPTIQPSRQPSIQPSKQPTVQPSSQPTKQPSEQPSDQPSSYPSDQPTRQPTMHPSHQPYAYPSGQPSEQPSGQPTLQPTAQPSDAPTAKPVPTMAPTFVSEGGFPGKLPISVIGTNAQFKIIYNAYGAISGPGNGFSDINVAQASAATNYVVFGGNHLKNINLASMSSSQGFSITPAISYDNSHRSVANAGDLNQDGYDDLVVGVPLSNSVYVFFGTAGGFVDMAQGFTIFGAQGGDKNGWSVSKAGDFNGDGYPDIIISALNVNYGTGAAYIIWGKKFGFTDISLSNLDPTQGINIFAPNNVYSFGTSVAGTGDFNGDGFDDVIISSEGNQYAVNNAYVIFGSVSASNIYAGNLSPAQGFIASGKDFAYVPYSVSSAGDVNGDGYADILIGSMPHRTSFTTQISYLIYGKAASNNIDLGNLGTQGIVIIGGGIVVSYIGDINNDGYADMMIGNNYNLNANGFVILTPAQFTSAPSLLPTLVPSKQPTSWPTGMPSSVPTLLPSEQPSALPSGQPSDQPTTHPSHPTLVPTFVPTNPTSQPTSMPSNPTRAPTHVPTAPSAAPTVKVTHDPTLKPTIVATIAPSAHPSDAPSLKPSTILPSMKPTHNSSPLPTFIHTSNPTDAPTKLPTLKPTDLPTLVPSAIPTILPTDVLPSGKYITTDITDGGTYYRSTLTTHFILNSTKDVTIAGEGSKALFMIMPYAKVSYIITHFNQSSDVINLRGFKDIHSMNDINFTIGSIIINLANEQRIKLSNLNLVDIAPNNFIFTQAEQQNQKTSNIDFIAGISVGLGTIALLGSGIYYYIYQYQPFKSGAKASSVTPMVIEEPIDLESNSHINHPEQEISIEIVEDQSVESQSTENSYDSDNFEVLENSSDEHESSSEAVDSESENIDKSSDNTHSEARNSLEQQGEDGLHSEAELSSDGQDSQLQIAEEDASNSESENADKLSDDAHSEARDSIDQQDLEDVELVSEEESGSGSELRSGSSASKSDVQPTREPSMQLSSEQKIETRNHVLCSIIDMMDKEHVRVQEVEFARFIENLAGYNFLTRNQAVAVIPTTKTPAQIAYAPTEPAPTADNMHSYVSNNNMMISLLSAQQLVEYIPIIKYMAQSFNLSIPEVLDNKPILVSAHLILGNAAAALLPYESMTNGMITSSIASSSYAIKLVSASYLAEQRQGTLTQDKQMSSFEMLKYCGASMLGFTLPSLAKCAVTKWFIPETECSIIGYDLGLSVSFAGADCYAVYKATSMSPSIPTTADVVIPYIADSIAFSISSQYVTLDMSSAAMAMQSMKQCMSVIASVVATDYMSRIAMDMAPVEIKEGYVEAVLDSIQELYVYGANAINKMLGVTQDY